MNSSDLVYLAGKATKSTMSGSSEAISDSVIELGSNLNDLDNEVDKAPSRTSLEKDVVDDDFSPVSAKLWFHLVLAKSHVKPYFHMVFPVKLCRDLPSTTTPAVIHCRGKIWEATVVGDRGTKKIDAGSWKKFVNENELEAGDALFWEVIESSNEKIKLKVQIIKGHFPAELGRKVDGRTENTPIIID